MSSLISTRCGWSTLRQSDFWSAAKRMECSSATAHATSGNGWIGSDRDRREPIPRGLVPRNAHAALAALPSGPHVSAPTKPTNVLVHGAWADAGARDERQPAGLTRGP